MNQGALCSTFQEIREVGIDDIPVAAKQQFFDLDRRLLSVPPRSVGVLFGWKIGFCQSARNRDPELASNRDPHYG